MITQLNHIIISQPQLISQLKYMPFDTHNAEIGPKMAKIAQISWKLRETCVKLLEEVHEILWKYHHWISQLKYMLFHTQHVEISPKMAKIAKIALNCYP